MRMEKTSTVFSREVRPAHWQIRSHIQWRKIFIHLLNKTPEEAKEYYDNEVDLRVVREISQDDSMPSIRTYILVCGLIDRSRSEAALAIDKVSKAYKRTPKRRRAVEATLYNEAIDKVVEFNPKWNEFLEYKLEIVEESKKD